MNEKFKRFTIYNLFFLCAFFSLFMVLGLKTYASESLRSATLYGYNGEIIRHELSFTYYKSDHTCIYLSVDNGRMDYAFLSLSQRPYDVIDNYTYVQNGSTGTSSSNLQWVRNYVIIDGHTVYYYVANPPVIMNRNITASGIPVFYDINDAYQYLYDGIEPELPYDDNLKLDSFKVTSWQIGTSQLVFRSKFVVTWSDPRIANVQVKIVGTANSPASFEANTSPFKQKFYADNYVMKNGDVIHLTATPFTSNGIYGESLYYSIVYNDGLPSNWYRKLVNTPYNDNTLTIPYTNVSSQPTSLTLPVDGVTTNKVYKVNYNPVTYEYGDINLYEIYYSPVVVYPDETPEEEIDETQDVITNVYTTNNYNTINNNTNYDFNINFGDISNNDIQDSYNDVGNFLNGFGSFLAKVVSFFGILFPFFPTEVSIAIITAFGIIVLVLIVAFVIKIVSAIKNFIFP